MARTKQAQATKLSAKQETLTEVQSLCMLKNSIKTAISSITYLRNLFEENAYEDKLIADLPLKLLRPCNAEAELVLSWLERGVFDALDKKFLRVLLFGIHDEHDNLIEFAYGDHENDSSAQVNILNASTNGKADRCVEPNITITKASAKEQTLQLLRSLILITQDLAPLPDARYMSMKLWYYDDKVPDAYEPELFHAPFTDDENVLKFGDIPAEIHIGRVDTGHHSLEVKVKTTTVLFMICSILRVFLEDQHQMSQPNGQERVKKGTATDGSGTAPLALTIDEVALAKWNDDPELQLLVNKAIEFVRHQSIVKTGMLNDILKIGSMKLAKRVIDCLVEAGILDKYLRKRQGWPVLVANNARGRLRFSGHTGLRNRH